MTVLVTGAAGFIGYHVAEALLGRGEAVLGVDNLSPYYDVALKEARLARLARHPGFRFLRLDIADTEAFRTALSDQPTPRVVHLAAQAGVRHSIEHPFDYVSANLVGHLLSGVGITPDPTDHAEYFEAGDAAWAACVDCRAA